MSLNAFHDLQLLQSDIHPSTNQPHSAVPYRLILTFCRQVAKYDWSLMPRLHSVAARQKVQGANTVALIGGFYLAMVPRPTSGCARATAQDDLGSLYYTMPVIYSTQYTCRCHALQEFDL